MMKWFYDLKIKMKVLLGFCFVAIIAGIIGYIGIYNLEVNNERGTSLYQNNTIGVQYVGDIAANQQKVRMLIRDVIIEKSLAGKNKYMASIQALDKTCDERIAALEELMDTEQEKKDLVDLKSAIGNYRPIRDQISQLSLAGKDDVALILMRGDGAKVGGELDQAVAKVFKTEIDSAKTTADENTASTNSAVYIMIGFLLVGIVIAIGLGIFIARGISNPLQQSLAMIQEMGRGHLGQRLHMETKDEVGMMAQAMDQFADDLQNNVIGTMHKIANGDISTEMVAKDSQDEITPALKNTIDSLRGLITEAKVLTDAAVQGKLDIRGDVTKFKGAYQEIVKGINDTLDSVIGPLNVAAEYIDRISKGDIPPKVTDTYYGDFNEIKNNLNQCIDGLGALVESKEVVGRMAVNDYTKRVEGHYLGIFADIASSINGVRDRLIHVQDIVQNIALGDFKDLNDLKAVGRRSEQDKLIPSLLAMVESVRGLVEETIGLAQNAVEGNLAYRGDAKKFNGEYQKVVEGINQTLDAISAPVIEAITVLEEMAKGNLQVSVKGNYRGDQAKIKDALNFTIGNLQSYIGEISGTLTEMANGNLDVAIDRDYLGDFMEIKNSLNLIIESFNDVLNDLNSASEQVASGSKHVSASSQALSQGSSEQASTVEEINSSMAEIATQTKQNAVNANQANELALAAKDNAVNGNEQMKGMLGAMAEINEASTNISKIIKVIDDIAFQTNILALNAAVEAARAGQHGKGFAVVAEEVRNLAARSADAAKETTSLIEGTVKKVEAGAGIANQTATALDQIVDGVTKATNLVGEIAGASNEQATAITQVNQGISQVATVIQNNTATAEESAAASEQLSSQAELLKSMVAKFQIKDQDGRRSKTVAMKTAGHLETAAPKPKKVKIALDDKDFAKY